MSNVKISVCMISYNQSRYIEKAIRSVLTQKTDFTYEIVIGDDASTDGTQQIIQSLYEKYQDKIKPILRKENLGSSKNSIDTLLHCTGEYVAFLEGDDYWIDESKLQKQALFLDSHSEYSAYYHKNQKIDENDDILLNCDDRFCTHRDFTLEDLCNFDLPGQLATAMIRRDVIERLDKAFLEKTIARMHYTPGDRILTLYLFSCGKIYCSNDVMSAYRWVRKEGGTNWTSKYGQDNAFVHWIHINMRRELELLGKTLNVPISFERQEYEAFIDACWKWRFAKKRMYFFIVVYMLIFSKYKETLRKEGVKKLKDEINVRKEVAKEQKLVKKTERKLNKKTERDNRIRSMKEKCPRLVRLLKKLKTALTRIF